MRKPCIYCIVHLIDGSGCPISTQCTWAVPLVQPLDGLLQGHHVCQLSPLKDDEKQAPKVTSRAKVDDHAIGARLQRV